MDNRLSYDKIADKWSDFRNKCVTNKCVEEFAELLPCGARVLDVGCGTGYPIDRYLTDKGFEVVGIDVSEGMLSHARALCLDKADFIKCDFLDYNDSKKFDAIIAFDSLWHVPLADQAKLYEKAAELLKTGGFLMFTHGKDRGEVENPMFGETFCYAALGLDELLRALKRNGFQIVRFEKNYKEKTTGTRDLLVFAKKDGLI